MKSDILLGFPFSASLISSAIHPLRKEQIEESEINSIKYKGDGHLVTFAPTGSGKGVSAIIPNLLHYKGPVIVIDPKGENFAVTARYRQNTLKQKIYLLDPFKYVPDDILSRVDAKRDALNPLDVCLLQSEFEMEAQMMSNLIADGGTTDEKFWDNHATKIISGLIYQECAVARRENRQPSFSEAIKPIFEENPTYSLSVMMDTKKPPLFVRRAIGSGFLSLDAKETKDGMLATVQSQLNLFTSDDIASSVNKSTFSYKSIQNDTDYTLYIVIPPNKLDSHQSLLKLWIGTLMQVIMDRMSYPETRTLFILDECANLGFMEILLKAVTLLRGYGLQVWMFFQDLAQMKQLYGMESQTMINNCGVFQTFGISRKSSAASISALLGTYSISDILNLDGSQQILSFSPGKTKMAKLLRYYDDKIFRNRYDLNHRIK